MSVPEPQLQKLLKHLRISIGAQHDFTNSPLQGSRSKQTRNRVPKMLITLMSKSLLQQLATKKNGMQQSKSQNELGFAKVLYI